ncbi:coniferyl-alcohol dehydrogenase [Mycobacterium sp. shizuoka-1]|uniref:coniferyl-alcohol dehydrogenase n=1 Tax=Mycobacterium sp. shizuoka-1 TaxID=2039281 RepID=UPI000C065F66|nr:coniferyl-alcohol dehydrogenase [Mycobacterium sp. shizuoka-1]GAY13546.1 3-alpha-hydroxysteroid dehydrogenase [Mycobacterium sp. shizuoka-1]
MAHIDDLLRYDGRRVVVTGCASGIGAHLCGQLSDLGAEVVGLDVRPPASGAAQLSVFVEIDLADAGSVDRAATTLDGPLDGLFNVAGVSSGIGNPLLVVTINFLGTRQFTEAMLPKLVSGSSVVCVSSLAAANYRDNLPQAAGLLATGSMADGIVWCHDHPEALADGGYRLSKEAIIGYTVTSAVPLGARGIRINCTGPGVTETPILDQLRSAYGQGRLDDIPKPLGRVSNPAEQAAVLVFLGSRAAGYITGQVVWADGGTIAARQAADYEKG